MKKSLKLYPNVEWVIGVMGTHHSGRCNGEIVAYIFVRSIDAVFRYYLSIPTTPTCVYPKFKCHGIAYNTLEEAKYALESEIVSRNRQIKIRSILKELK